jgi:hypothetical protein
MSFSPVIYGLKPRRREGREGFCLFFPGVLGDFAVNPHPKSPIGGSDGWFEPPGRKGFCLFFSVTLAINFERLAARKQSRFMAANFLWYNIDRLHRIRSSRDDR